ncbi:MAG: HAMP domain-containing sensor histidine kinase [Anaerolineales bacterium]|jgi:signal transduction histidine kinase
MDNETLELFTKLSDSNVKDDWKKALNSLFITLRTTFVFDNLAIYLIEMAGALPEPVYARGVGRGRSKEAEASWGEEIANQVVATDKITVVTPSGSSSSDRIDKPYLLGLPLNLPTGKGAIVFVRFGGPEYTAEQMPLAALAAVQTDYIFENRTLKESQTQLEIARQRAQFQDDFIATISHQFHTPLGFIKGYTTSLLRSDTVWDPETQREFLNIIDEESDHLVTLIDRILDSARLQSGTMPMEFQPVRLDSLLRDVILRTQSRYKDLEIVQNIGTAPPIHGDSVHLAQVFDNLFDNAIKYAPGSRITISLKVDPKKQIVNFTDRGAGIPSEYLPFLFERFYRVPGNPSKRGTGLGLFICKEIIQAHHGEISVKTVPGKGTTFQVELPADIRKVS